MESDYNNFTQVSQSGSDDDFTQDSLSTEQQGISIL